LFKVDYFLNKIW